MCTAVCASDVIHRVSMCIQSTKYTYVCLKVFLRVPSRMRLFPSDGSSGSQQRECQQRGLPTDGLRGSQKKISRQRHPRRGGSQKRRSPLRASGVPRRGDPGRGIHGFPEVEIPAEGFRGFQKRDPGRRIQGFPQEGIPSKGVPRKLIFSSRVQGIPTAVALQKWNCQQRGSGISSKRI